MDIYHCLKIMHHVDRPNVADYIRLLFPDFLEMHGDRFGEDDPAIIGGIAMLNRVPVTIIGHKRGHTTEERMRYNFSMPNPEGYRKAIRLMKQAEKFGRPVLLLIDTPGAHPGSAAEEHGQFMAISNCISQALELKVPIISVLLGNGGSGGALAFCVSDRLIAFEYASLSIISPKACANILWRDSSRDCEAAFFMKMMAPHLYDLKIVNRIVEEPADGAHMEPHISAKRLLKAIELELGFVRRMPISILVWERKRKYRRVGKSFLV